MAIDGGHGGLPSLQPPKVPTTAGCPCHQDDSSLQPGAPPGRLAAAKGAKGSAGSAGRQPKTSGVLLKKDPDMHKEPLF